MNIVAHGFPGQTKVGVPAKPFDFIVFAVYKKAFIRVGFKIAETEAGRVLVKKFAVNVNFRRR